VLWVNEYFGRVEPDGRPLSDLPVYREYPNKVWGSVANPKRNRDTFGGDVEVAHDNISPGYGRRRPAFL
jgi:hypothetical protein